MMSALEELISEEGGKRPEPALLAEAARELGYRLPHAKLEELRDLRAEIASARQKLESQEASELSSGVLLALGQVALAYGTEIERLAERERAAVRARSDSVWAALVRQLDRGPARPSALTEQLAKDPAQISRGLRVLEQEGLVRKLPVRGDRRGTLYCLTAEGARTASALRKERVEAPVEEPAHLVAGSPAAWVRHLPLAPQEGVYVRTVPFDGTAGATHAGPSLQLTNIELLHRAAALAPGGPKKIFQASQPLLEHAIARAGTEVGS